MIELSDLVAPVVIVVAALFASTLAAVAGFGGAAVMLPVLVWALGIRDAVPVLTIAQLLGNLSRVWFNRTELSFNVVRWFTLGAVPTAIIGGVIFATAPAPFLVRGLGMFLLLVVAYRHTPLGRDARIGLRGFTPVGGMAAFVSALTGVAGPFMAPFFLSYGLVKGAYIGTEALATVTMHVTKLGVYGAFTLLSVETIMLGVAIGGVMFVGSYAGKRILNHVPEKVFPLLVEGVLIFAGLWFVIWG